MSTKLFVGNLPFTASDADLEAHFAQAGTVETVNVVRERDTGRPRGFRSSRWRVIPTLRRQSAS